MLDRLNEIVWTFRSQFSAIPEYDFDSQGEIVQNYSPIKWTNQGLFMLGMSGLIGAAFGVLVAMSVNTTLVEISVSSAFSLVSSECSICMSQIFSALAKISAIFSVAK